MSTKRLVETVFGFEWGPVKVERCFSDEKTGWVTLRITTAKYPNGLQVYVTKTGKVRIHDSDGEWLSANEAGKL